MRLTKMLGLAALGAVAAMALLGTGSAFAEAEPAHHRVGLCEKQELLLCEAKWLIPVASGQLLGKATNPVLEGTLAEKCTSSLAKGKITGELDELKQLKGQIDSLTFTGCSPCKNVKVNNLPLAAELTMATIGGSDWVFISKGNADLTECAFGLTCKFGSEKVTSLVEMTETGAVLNTNKAELQFEGGSEFFCGKTGKWNAKYALTWTLNVGGKEDLVFPTLLGEGHA